jgi:23S rRNA (pseudouridine1915-N3)-methyltransferase
LLSSEDLAARLGKLRDDGVSQLEIAVGGADGVPPELQAALRPDLLWSFGSLTLPHELAAVVAGEQVYRAWTILKNHPYHGGH